MTVAIPPVGSLAPDFTLPSTSGTDFTLSSLRGKQHVLLAFFPLAFTGTCTDELRAFSTEYSEFTGRGTVVFPVSVDSVDTLKVFKKQETLAVDLLSDFKRKVSELYGVLNAEKFYSNRSYFLVDKTGTLRWAHVEENNGKRRPNSELLAQVEALG
jgi:peroxiredoxin